MTINPFSRDYWEEKAREAWINLGNPPPAATDRNYDAFRHTYTSALWTKMANEGIAKSGGEHIELTNRRNFESERGLRDMRGDLINNSKGRELGDIMRQRSDEDIAREVEKALKRGDLVTQPQTDPRTMEGNFPPHLWTPDLDKRRWDYYRRPEFNKEFRRVPPPPPTFRIVWVDPLVVDLDGDGIETTGITVDSHVVFDHDGDGLKTGTGWVARDDAWLVRDLNGNGSIDSGAEMFGDQTSLPSGQKAATGLAALTALDSNGDGWIDERDAAFGELQVWQDLNQDGVANVGEMKALVEAGLARISVQPHAAGDPAVMAVAGGQYRASSVVEVMRADGSVTTAADLSVASDPFYSSYVDQVAVPEEMWDLPNMQGMGRLRDLQEAAVLSPELATLLSTYASSTRTQQRAMVRDLLVEWAKTDPHFNDPVYEDFTSWGIYDANSANVIAVRRSAAGGAAAFLRPPNPVASDSNFARDVRLMDAVLGVRSGVFFGRSGINWRAEYALRVAALEEVFFDTLLSQTTLRKYLDQVSYTFDATGIQFDFSTLEELLHERHATDPRETILDLADLLRIDGKTLLFHGWETATDMLRGWVEDASADVELQATLRDMHVKVAGGDSRGSAASDILLGRSTSDYLSAGEGDDIADAGAGSDLVYGGEGHDFLQGGAGNDTLHGDAGNDLLDGGIGNDILRGGQGSDIYSFGRGGGQDYISNRPNDAYYLVGNPETDASSTTDVLQFKPGVSLTDLEVSRTGDDLLLRIRGTTDSVTLGGFFHGNSINHTISLDRIEFADGSQLSDADVLDRINAGSEGNDVMYGTEGTDNMNGGAGTDALYGGGGNDVLLGGSGADYLRGQAGNDTLDGGAGRDTMQGGAGSDVYLFGRGDGADLLRNQLLDFTYNGLYPENDAGSTVDTLRFKEGVSATDLAIARSGNDLVLRIRDSGDSITLEGFFAGNVINHSISIDRIEFADGSLLTDAQIEAAVMTGTDHNDTIYGTEGPNVMSGGGGSDALYGAGSNDTLLGGSGADYLRGQGGNDTLDGGSGNDTMQGGQGSDVYLFGRGDGADLLRNQLLDYTYNGLHAESDAGSTIDTLRFKEGVTAADLAITRSGDNLVLRIKDSGDSVALEGFFAGNVVNHSISIDRIEFADGSLLTDAQIEAAVMTGGSHGDTIYGTEGANIMSGGGGNDLFYGAGGNDTLLGGSGADYLRGQGGNDTLDGNSGNDIMQGGQGSDVYLFGRGDGADLLRNQLLDFTYNGLYAESDAGAAVDVLRFKDGVAADDLAMVRNGSDLVLHIKDTSDGITLEGFFYGNAINHSISVDRIEFADGTELTDAQIQAGILLPPAPLPGAPSTTLNGTGGADMLIGSGNDEQLYGGGGSDTLDGGAGDDFMQGGTGSDVYLFGRGDGWDSIRNNTYFANQPNQNDSVWTSTPYYYADGDWGSATDILRFKEGVGLDDLVVRRNGAHLVVGIKGTEDQVTVEGYFGGNFINKVFGIDGIQFADGTPLTDAQVQAMLQAGTDRDDVISGINSSDIIDTGAGDDVVYAAGGNDTVLGGDGNDALLGEGGTDTLDGGAGDDFLQGGTGSDVYLFGRGDGQDSIRNNAYFRNEPNQNDSVWTSTPYYYADGDWASATDILRFKEGVAIDDLVVMRNGAHLVIGIRGTEDQVTVEGYFGGNFINKVYGIDGIQFADGTALTDAQVQAMLQTGSALDDVIAGINSSDAISTGAGDDVIYAAGGNDTVLAGKGSDVLLGEGGNDTLDGGAGDDFMQAGTGSDVYLFGRGDGRDIIRNSAYFSSTANPYDSLYTNTPYYYADGDWGSAIDVLRFKEGITADDLVIGRNGAHLVIGIRDTSDTITVEGHFGNNNVNVVYGLDRFEFADGSVLTDAAFRAIMFTGGEGDDSLAGLNSNDTMDGGAGDDTLAGDRGNDTYVFRRDSGNDRVAESVYTDGGTDTVALDTGIAPGDVVLYRNLDDLVIGLNAGEATMSIASFFSTASGAVGPLEQMRFADGTLWNRADMLARVQAPGTGNDILVTSAGNDSVAAGAGNDSVSGRAGDDRLLGEAGNDRLAGGLDNDTLVGGTGSDTYVFQAGDGRDTVDNAATDAAAATDTIEFLDVNRADVRFIQREGNDLTLHYAESDSITVSGWFSGNRVDQVQFADASRMTAAEIEIGFPIQLSDYADTMAFGAGDQQVDGRAGNDVVDAGAGNDTVVGGEGDDALTGGTGDDSLDGGEGLNSLQGGAGNDTLRSAGGEDILRGCEGSDTYRVTGSFSNVVIDNQEADNASATDILELQGILPEDVLGLVRQGDDISIVYGAGATITIRAFYRLQGSDTLDTIRFADGTAMTPQQLVERFPVALTTASEAVQLWDVAETVYADEGDDVLAGNGGNDNLWGEGGDDLVSGGEGDDMVDGCVGNDQLQGGNGSDRLFGQEGDDVLDGGAGSDQLQGGIGSDSYLLQRSGGADFILDAEGALDQLLVGGDVVSAQLQFSRNGDQLTVAIAGSDDSVAIEDWFGAGRIERIVLADRAIEAMEIEALFNNRTPQAQDDTGIVFEDGVPAIGNVLANDTDPDAGQVLSVTTAGVFAGLYGTLILNADGSYAYVLDSSLEAVQQLGRGATLGEQFAYQVTDDSSTPRSAGAVLRLEIAGTNDGPVLQADAAVLEYEAAWGNVLLNDSDADAGDTLSVVDAGLRSGQFGQLYLAPEGFYTYHLDPSADAFRRLAGGETFTEQFGYLVTDGAAFAESTLSITVMGYNDLPEAAADATVVGRGVLEVQGNVLMNDSDPDAGAQLTVLNAGGFALDYGWLTLHADGSYDFRLSHPGAYSLGRDASEDLVFQYFVTDGVSPPVAGELTITVLGENDAPFASDDQATVVGDGSATGNVLFNDRDVDTGDRLSVANAGRYAGLFGQLDLAADGSYRYLLDGGSQALLQLGAGQSATEQFTTVTTDGLAQVATTLTLTLNGVNDAPVVAHALQDRSVRENLPFLFTLPAGAFTDVDAGDSLSYSAGLVDADGQLEALPYWMVFDAPSRSFLGLPNFVQGGDYQVRVVATDGSGASVADDFTISVADQGRQPDGRIVGGSGPDVLNGGAGSDSLNGGNEDDLLFGNGGDDLLSGANGADLLYAGRGGDRLDGGNGEDWLAGNQGNDLIAGGNGRDLVAFNRGDGADILQGERNGRDVISLGNGIRYADLSLARSGSDLVLRAGQGESLTLQDWYAGKGNAVDRLQVVILDGDYDAASGDATRNKAVQVFDFARIVQRFDAARLANQANANGWAVTNSLLDAHLQGSNGAALGGDLSFQYATAGSFSGLGVAAVQGSLGAGGMEWQALKPRSELEQGFFKLS